MEQYGAALRYAGAGWDSVLKCALFIFGWPLVFWILTTTVDRCIIEPFDQRSIDHKLGVPIPDRFESSKWVDKWANIRIGLAL